MNKRAPAPNKLLAITLGRDVPHSLVPITPYGKYTLIGKLGHGGMAEVFLAYVAGPAGFRKLCVIKRLHSHLEDEPGFLDMFLDEARLAARLNHPNVVQTYEVGEVTGSHFISMEYLEGQGLDRLQQRCIRTGVNFPPNIAAQVIIEALQGLHYAHNLKDFDGSDLGIIHRDVSPQNVFVSYEGAVKLLDFGIAKAATHEVETRVGVIKGKFAYIAPEQARGEKIDIRADIWSMGVVLWEALTGRRLFEGPNDIATLSEALTSSIPKVSEFVEVPSTLDDIVGRALTRSRDERYPTALAFKNELKEFLLSEYPATSSEEVAEFVKTLFADIIKQNKKVLKVCLSDIAAGQVLSSGEYRMLRQTSSGELTLANTTSEAIKIPSGSYSRVITAITSSPADISTFSDLELKPHSELSQTEFEVSHTGLWGVLLLLLPFVGIGIGWFLHSSEEEVPETRAEQPLILSKQIDTSASLRKAQSIVSLTSNPSGAKVLFGGKVLGRTPLEHSLDQLPRGAEASFVFRLAGQKNVTVSSPLHEERVAVHAEFGGETIPITDAGMRKNLAPQVHQPASAAATEPAKSLKQNQAHSISTRARRLRSGKGKIHHSRDRASRAGSAKNTDVQTSQSGRERPSAVSPNVEHHGTVPIID